MPDEPAKKGKPTSPQKAPDISASIEKKLKELTLQRNLTLHMPSLLATSEALKGMEDSTRKWLELSKTFDWTKSASLQTEAQKAMDFGYLVTLQAEMLKALEWDIKKMPLELRSPVPAPHAEKSVGGLELELRQLREAIAKKSEALLAEKADAAEKERRIADLNRNLAELRQRERLAFLLNQVHPAAQHLLEADEDFRNRFLKSKDCTGFVLSIDIRRSTELMLKARKPEQYAGFIASLSRQLTEVVLESFGVFDKFTGDGILAFFPDFYSGRDAGFHALSASVRCHEIFQSHYRDNRNTFISVLQDTGLGIGIDFGTLHLVQLAGALTVVGRPVVYACRFGGAPSGSTLLNQPAFEVLSERFGTYFSFKETSIELKHEGRTLAYSVHPSGKTYEPQVPEWFKVPVSGDVTGSGRK